MKKIIISVFTLLALVSCKTYSHSSRTIDVNNESIESKSFSVEVVPDFTRRLNASSTKKHASEKSAKEEAYFNAIVDNSIDVLVSPIYSTTVSNGMYETTVYGYAGYYKNPKTSQQVKKDNYDQTLNDLQRLGQIDGILEESEEKTYTVNSTCGDCKGNAPLTLISVIKNKSSLVEIYNRLKK